MLSRYSDENYFYLVRNYLGQISTPFHKPALTDRLTTFFLNEHNQDRILALIDDEDAKILSAVWLMKDPTENDLFDLFLDEFSYAELQRRIVNLEERLLLLPEEDHDGKPAVAINPLLRQRLLESILSLRPLLGDVHCMFVQEVPSPALVTNEIFRGYLNLVVQELIPESATMEARFFSSHQLAAIFPTLEPERIPALFDMLRSVLVSMKVLLRNYDGKLMLDREKAKLLLQRDDRNLLTLLLSSVLYSQAIALGKKFSPESLFLRCRTALLEFIALMRHLPVLSQRDGFRIGKILAKRNGIPFEEAMFFRTIDMFLVLGVIAKAPSEQKGPSYYVTSLVKKLFLDGSQGQQASPLTVDSDCTVTYSGSRRNAVDIPEDLLYLIGEVRYVDTLSCYEITRQSYKHALDQGLVFDEIVEYLDIASEHKLQPNLVQLMGEWYAAYHSVRIYDGIVVCCDTRMTRIVDQHPQLQQYIVQRIQEGIYLFSRDNETKWRQLLKNAGADMLPRTVHEENGEAKPFTTRSLQTSVELPQSMSEEIIRNIQQELERSSDFSLPKFNIRELPVRNEPWTEPAFLQEISNAIEKLRLTEVDAEEMDSRFRSRLLIIPQQVVKQRLSTGLLSASGFDFRGKVNLCRSAIGDNGLVLEIHVNEGDEGKVLIVKAKELINPTSKDAMLKAVILPSMEERTIPISRMFLVKRQRLSLLGGQV